MDVAVPMVLLQHYLNPCLHYLIGPAMVTLIMWHLDDAVEISRGRYCRLQKSIPKDARWGGTLHLSMLTSGRYSNHSKNVMFSPKLRVTQLYLSLCIIMDLVSEMCHSTRKLHFSIDELHSSLLSHLRVFLEDTFYEATFLFRGTCLITVSAGS